MSFSSVSRAATRGMVGAMAMTGLRQVTTGLGLLERTPPQQVISDQVPNLVRPLSEDHEDALLEVAHCGYGALGGAVFGLLPGRLRRSRLAGPVYGTAVWLGYEFAIAPALGIEVAKRRTVAARAMLALDHVLYGVVVAGQLAPEPEREAEVATDHDIDADTGTGG